MTSKYKILLIGDGNVGKTTWLRRFATGEFRSSVPIYRGEIQLLSFYTSRGLFQLEIWDWCSTKREAWDTANAESAELFANVDGIIGLFDVTNPQSFESLIELMDQTKKNCDLRKLKFSIFVGNKYDLLDKKSCKAMYPFADYFISANTNRNYEMPFLHALKILRNEPSLRLVEAPPIRAPEAKSRYSKS